MSSIVRNSVYNVLYAAANVVFSLVSSVYVSRILLPEGLGKYSYILTFATYFVSIASLGIPVYGVREIAKVRKQVNEKNVIFSELFYLGLVSSVLSFSIYLLVVLNSEICREDLGLYLRLGLLIVVNMLNIDWLYKGEESYRYIAIRSIAVKVCSIVLLVLCVHDVKDINRYAEITVLASCGNYLYNLFHARKFVKFTIKGLNILRHLKPNIVLTISAFFGEIYNKIDITMLGFFSTERAIGIYGNAHKIVNIVITCCAAITATFLPRISNVVKVNSKETARLINRGLEILVFLSIPSAIGLCAISNDMVEFLYGDLFLDAAVTINILAGLVIIRGIGDLVCYQLLVGCGQENLRIPANIVTTLLNIALNRLFIPQMGENGAALASLISELFVNGYLYIKMKKKFMFNIRIFSILQATLASGIMYLYVYLIQQVDLPSGISIVGSILGAVLVYVLVNIMLKNEIMMMLVERLKRRFVRS